MKILHPASSYSPHCPSLNYGQDKINEKINTIIRNQGLNHGSKVMDVHSNLDPTDVAWPATYRIWYDRAQSTGQWAGSKDGMQNVHVRRNGVHLEGMELNHFGNTQWISLCTLLLVILRHGVDLLMVWSQLEVIYLNANWRGELSKYKGKLSGKIVLLDTFMR